MNRDALYVAILTVLCVLLGVLVGSGITSKANLPWPCREKPCFTEKAERFMWHGPRQHPSEKFRGGKGGGDIFNMLAVKLELTEDQKGKVKEILEKTRREIDNLGASIRGAMSEIKEKGDKQITDILTPQQQEKFKELCKSKGPERECAMGGPGRGHGSMRENGPGGDYGPAGEDGPFPGEAQDR
ncbi:MAG: hypothetical protein WC522_09225 [Candidatus Omnitrophota bacterium]